MNSWFSPFCITTVKRSAFSVCTFEFPLNFTQNFGPQFQTLTVGLIAGLGF